MAVILFKFEIYYWLRNRPFYLYFATFFLFSAASMAGAAGFFGEGSAQEGTIANTPLNLFSFTLFFQKLLLLVVPAITGITVNREIKDNVHCLLFTYPISKFAFVASKILAAYTLLLLLALGIVAGLAAGTLLAAEGAVLRPFDPMAYGKIFFLFLAPNLFLFSSIVFVTVLFTRNPYHGFLAILIAWLLREIMLRLTAGVDSGLWWDPLGESSLQNSFKFLNISQRNDWQLTLTNDLLWNRLTWIAATMVMVFTAYRKYGFSIDAGDEKRVKSTQTGMPQTSSGTSDFVFNRTLNKRFDLRGNLSNIFSIAKFDFRFIYRDPGFMILAGAGQAMTAILLLQTNPGTDMKLLPSTAQVLGYPFFFYSFLVQLLTFLYAGIVVNRAPQSGIQDLLSVTPVPNSVLLAGKLLAVIKMQVLLLAIFGLSGMAIQIYAGYYHFEGWLYIRSLLFIHLPGFIIWAMAAIFVHSWASNTYTGLFILLLFSLSIYQLADLGIQSSLFRFNTTPESDFFLRYSDMNGYGHAFGPFLLYKTYWFIAAVVLTVVATTGWQREKTFQFKERILLAKNRLLSYPLWVVMTPVFMLLVTGSLLYFEENKPGNLTFTSKQEGTFVKTFEAKFKPYLSTAQPIITALKLTIDIFPEKQSYSSTGTYTIQNQGITNIDTILLKSSFNDITQYHWDLPVTLLGQDTVMQVVVIKLSKPLAPQDSMLLRFSVINKANTLLTQNSPVLKNGTYLKSSFLPAIGWQPMEESKRVMENTRQHYQRADEHGVCIQTTISTSGEQVAFAPGTLEKKWTHQNRNYYHYLTANPVKLVFGILSGMYQKAEEIYKGIPIRIFHHPGHTTNLSRLMEGAKASLDYHTNWFGPYLHKDLNIIAFSRAQGTFASLSANCITVSETRFMQDTGGLHKSGTDLSFYVMAHELSHHWWGNQLLPARAPGATMLTESIAEYLTTRVYEKKYGKARAMKFLTIQKNRYLSGVADAAAPENPLVKVAGHEDYIAYGKGSVAFYTLSEKTGEATLNRELAAWMKKFQNPKPPYPLASDLLNHLRISLPPAHHGMLTALFETAGPGNMEKYVDWWNHKTESQTIGPN